MDLISVLSGVAGTGVFGFIYQWANNRGAVKFTEYQIAMNYITPSWGGHFFRYFLFNLRFENTSKKKRMAKIDRVVFCVKENEYELALESALKPSLNLSEMEIKELPFRALCEDLIDVTECVKHFSEVRMKIYYSIDGKSKHRELKGENLQAIELDTVYTT